MGAAAAIVVVAGHGTFAFVWAASSADHYYDNDGATSDDFGDDDNCFDSIDFDSDSSVGCYYSPISWEATDSASFEDDDASSRGYRT